MEEPVVVARAENETEAELICGLLRSGDIKCGYRPTEAVDSAFYGLTSEGPQDVMVAPADEAAAKVLLAEARG
jgi:hypothetical protein